MTERFDITTWLPSYEEARNVIRFLNGKPDSHLQSMIAEIAEKWWSRDFTSQWSDPDEYIPVALSGENQAFARSIWQETNVNPRSVENTVLLARHRRLAEVSDDDLFTLTEAGKLFQQCDEAIVNIIDQDEGLLVILAEIAAKGPGESRQFLPAFREFFLSFTTFSAKNSGGHALNSRLNNLSHRGLIDRRGKLYGITDAGLDYLRRLGRHLPRALDSTYQSMLQFSKDNEKATREKLSQYLSSIDPYQFEHLIKHLLEVMGYENVEVTGATNDKGVDVVGEIELGISRVREAIQVKRQQSNVGRGVLDSLRGSLHRFDAVRATIITTSGFAASAKEAAFEKGAAPITLIDGEHLLDLLIEHKIGARKEEISYLEFDPDSLAQFQVEDGEIVP